MTRDEILNMPAGREMDRIIAKHALEVEEDDDTWLWFVSPNYSTDVSMALDMADHLQKKLGTCKFYFIVDPKQGNNIRAIFDPLLEDDHFEASADTAPLAICRAALLAVMK